MLAVWLSHTRISGWWGSRASAEARIRLAIESSTAIRRGVRFGGDLIGYAQAVDFGDGSDVTRGLPVGTWECDVLIGSHEHQGRGFGIRALGLIAAWLMTFLDTVDGKLAGVFKSSGLRPHFMPRAAYYGLDKVLMEAMG